MEAGSTRPGWKPIQVQKVAKWIIKTILTKEGLEKNYILLIKRPFKEIKLALKKKKERKKKKKKIKKIKKNAKLR